jgi:hypothetical protein
MFTIHWCGFTALYYCAYDKQPNRKHSGGCFSERLPEWETRISRGLWSSLPGAAENKDAELITILKGHIKLQT